MNREIKFRFWDGKTMSGLFSLKELMESIYRFSFDKVRTMQYIGLKDKNGKEIYEGDIVEHKNIELRTGDRYKIKGSVIFEKAGFSVKAFFDGRRIELMDYSLFYPWGENKGNWEVIGNIYENKELLK